MSRRQLYTIAPDAPFLATLAERVLDGALLDGWRREGPFWLCDVTIVLPTRRARLALAEAFRARGHELLPDIRAFGGEAAEEEPFLPPVEADVLPEPVARLERRLVLARLVAAWAQTAEGRQTLANPPNPGEILALADELAQLIDDLNTEDVPFSALRNLTPEDLAANWQRTLKFLDLALTAWPAILAERGRRDMSDLRNARLDRQAATAPELFGERPVIAAGSTGSIPATARLIGAIADLPRGAVVLPGLDTTISAKGHAALLDPDLLPHGNPQYGLMRLLRRLDAGIADVAELAPGSRPARTTIVRKALALADNTALWASERAALGEAAIDEGLRGITMLAARTAEEEARAIALAARDGLVRGLSVGIVSPDRNLARRIAAELMRFDILVDDAAGAPLFQAASGRLARQILAVAASDCSAVDLMALLRNRASVLGFDRAAVSRAADLIEMGLLRGQRPAAGIEGLRKALADNLSGATQFPAARLWPGDGETIAAVLTALERALASLMTLLAGPRFTAADFATALGGAFAAVLAGGSDGLPGRREFEDWLAEVVARPGDGPALVANGIDGVLYRLMAGFEVRNVQPRRDDIAIWGQLEARLQNPGLMILAGVNEDIWPEAADPGPWMSRGMRLAAGLEPPERKQGLAAHDFEMALGNKEVIVAFAQRLGTSPALPSRFVQRLEAFAGEDAARAMRRRGLVWREAQLLDAAAATKPAERPAPRPPANLRPRRLSVTEIETLFRSPYDLYAKHVLRLKQLDPLGSEPGARERGSMIHEVFARFVLEGRDFAAPDAFDTLMAMAGQSFAGLAGIGDRRDIWLKRFEVAARAFLSFERDRAASVAGRRAEIGGDWPFPSLDDFHLTGRADRIDLMADGTLEIIDFKTGSVPLPKTMKAFEAPQLLLEAAMAAAGAFTGLAPAPSGALTYIKIGLGPDAFVPHSFKPRDGYDLMGAADEASRRLQGHVAAFLLSDLHPMPARIRPDTGQRFAGAYEHLARTDEWTLSEADEAP